MTAPSLDALARRADRRLGALHLGIPLAVLAVATWAAIAYGPEGMIAAGVASWVLVWAPVVPSDASFELVTDKDPETVTAEFTGPGVPLFALRRRIASTVEDHEDGETFATTRLWRTARFRYEATRDGETDHSIRLALSRNGTRVQTVRVTVEATPEGSRVVGRTAGNRRRVGGGQYLFELAQRPYRVRALEREGYEPVDRAR